MKTIEDMFEKAFNIADNDPAAFVGVFCSLVHERDAIGQLKEHSGQYKHAQMLYQSHSGGRVRTITTTDLYALSGYQFSHVFLADYVAEETKQFVKSRIRSAYAHPVKMGVYHQSGIVEYVEAW